MKNSIIVNNEAELDKFAEYISMQCTDQYCIALHGDLGVGKTTFVKHLGKQWDIVEVKSPSFGIVDVHHGNRTLIHIDAYRLKDEELKAFDLDDLCTPPYCLIIEWPERLKQTFPFDLHLYFSILLDGSREIKWAKETLHKK